MSCPHAAAEATAASEATEAAPAAPIAGTPTHGYATTREEAMARFAKSWLRE
jgi:hypothetical protein